MPGIDFAALRARISILEVLGLLGFQPIRRNGDRLRGLCPMQCSQDPRAFVVDVATDRYYCHRCHCFGNQLEPSSQTQGLAIFDAAEALCQRLNIQAPQIHGWQATRTSPIGIDPPPLRHALSRTPTRFRWLILMAKVAQFLMATDSYCSRLA